MPAAMLEPGKLQEEAMGVRAWTIRISCALALTVGAAVLAGPAAAMDGIPGPGHGGGSGGGSPPAGFGQFYASLRSALLDDSRVLRDAVLGRSHDASASHGTGGWIGAHDASADAATVGLATMKGQRTSVIGGFDAERAGWRLGFAAGGGTARWRASAVGSDAVVDGWHSALWTGRSLGPVRVVMGAGYSHGDVVAHRTDSLGGVYRGGFSADVAQGFAEAALPLDAGPARLEPYGEAAWVGLRAKGFVETGGANPITGSGANQNVGYGDLGLRLGLGGGAIRPFADVSWRHAWGDLNPVLTGQIAGSGGGGVAMSEGVGGVGLGGSGDPSVGGAIADAGRPVRADSGAVKAGFAASLGRARLSFGYDGVFARGVHDQGAALRLSMAF